MNGIPRPARVWILGWMILAGVFCWLPTASAGARIDLRPDPPVPPGGYEPNTNLRMDVYFVDTGDPQGNVSFRGLFLDFSDSPPWGGAPGTLAYLGGNPSPSVPWDDGYFYWNDPFGTEPPLVPLPYTSWVYPLPKPIPLFQITMPENGEVHVGHTWVNVGTIGGTLNVTNADNPDSNFGARADFGFGGPNDPVTIWRAYTGELTGGVLDLPVVPEPGSATLLGIGLACAMRMRRNAK